MMSMWRKLLEKWVTKSKPYKYPREFSALCEGFLMFRLSIRLLKSNMLDLSGTS